MIIYAETLKDFIEDVDLNQLESRLVNSFKRQTGSVPSDRNVWADEYTRFANVLRRATVDNDIQVALENMKEHIRVKYNVNSSDTRVQSPTIHHNISIYDAYLYYCKFTTSASNLNLNELTTMEKQVVSKAYFEKYIYDNCLDHIIDNKFLSPEWYLI